MFREYSMKSCLLSYRQSVAEILVYFFRNLSCRKIISKQSRNRKSPQNGGRKRSDYDFYIMLIITKRFAHFELIYDYADKTEQKENNQVGHLVTFEFQPILSLLNFDQYLEI